MYVTLYSMTSRKSLTSGKFTIHEWASPLLTAIVNCDTYQPNCTGMTNNMNVFKAMYVTLVS